MEVIFTQLRFRRLDEGSITDMAFFHNFFLRNLIILLSTVYVCNASIQSVTMRFTEKKAVAKSHTTLHKISKIKCVEWCNKERQNNGRCTIAGYDKRTQTCYLSDDDPMHVLDTEDEMTGVFFYGADMNGKYHIFVSTYNTV